MKRSKSPVPSEAALHTISYFAFFGYPPNLEEVFAFFPAKIGRKKLQALLDSLVSRKKLLKSEEQAGATGARRTAGAGKRTKDLGKEHYDAPEHQFHTLFPEGENSALYTLPQYSMHYRNRALRREITINKLRHIRKYVTALARSPFVRLIGVSGSASMLNSKKGDDVDLCIVSAANRLFLARFWAILLAAIFGLRHGSGSVCLNLFLDEKDMEAPDTKKNYYVAHEVLQMKPVVNKNFTWERFLNANRWVYGFFPNATQPTLKPPKLKKRDADVFQLFERILGAAQLAVIRKNGTGFIITPAQLWLFRKDFQKKLGRKTGAGYSGTA